MRARGGVLDEHQRMVLSGADRDAFPRAVSIAVTVGIQTSLITKLTMDALLCYSGDTKKITEIGIKELFDD
jgi:hypothetical protein